MYVCVCAYLNTHTHTYIKCPEILLKQLYGIPVKNVPISHLTLWFSSVQFNHSVMSDSLQPHESQHTRPPCPSPTPKFTQTHVHRVCDAIQPSHPLLSPSPPAPNPSQDQTLFQWVNSSHEVAKLLEFQPQHQLPLNTQDWSPVGWTGWISLQSKGLTRVFSSISSQILPVFSGSTMVFIRTSSCDNSDKWLSSWPRWVV